MEECQSGHYQQPSFKYFVKSLSIQKILPKVSQIQTTIAGGTPEYERVKLLGVVVLEPK